MDKLKIKHSKRTDLKKYLEEIVQKEQKMQSMIDIHCNRIMDGIVEKINILKKELKIQVSERFFGIKYQIEELLEKQKDFESLNDIEDNFQKYVHQSMSIEELNSFLIEKQNKNIDTKIVQEVQKQGQNISYINIESDLNYLEKQVIQHFENQESSIKQHLLQQYIRWIPFSDHIQSTEIQDSGIIKVKEGKELCIFRSPEFRKEQCIKFSFQINFEKNDSVSIYIGLFSGKQIKKLKKYPGIEAMENMIYLSNTITQKPIRNITDKTIDQVYKNGQIYDVEVLYTENLFRISDRSKESIVENKSIFDQTQEKWHLCIGLKPGMEFKQI